MDNFEKEAAELKVRLTIAQNLMHQVSMSLVEIAKSVQSYATVTTTFLQDNLDYPDGFDPEEYAKSILEPLIEEEIDVPEPSDEWVDEQAQRQQAWEEEQLEFEFPEND